jgi:competence protein ComEA
MLRIVEPFPERLEARMALSLKPLPLVLALALCAPAQSLPAGSGLPEGLGRDLVEVICSSCHSTERITAKRLTRPQWQDKVLEMLQEESDVTQPERERIINYLAKSFPARVNVNTAAAKDIETGLELSAENAAAIVRYRERNGGFGTVGDLKKVPGVDAAKIEAKEDSLEF